MSALINPTCWLLCAAFAVCIAAADPRRALRSGLRWATAVPVLVVIACAAGANVGARALLGHAVPGDFVQEVVAADALRAHATLYPADVNGAAGEWLARHPPVLPGWLPGPVSQWLEGRQRSGRNRLVAQAHPPTLLLAMAPLVLVLGPYGAYWALTLLTIVAAALTAGVLVTVLAPARSTREQMLAVLALVSWQPVLATVRDGQVSVLIASGLVLGWAELRRGRDMRAGVAVGAAAVLKLYPLLILVLLAVRRHKACAAAIGIVAVGLGVVAIVADPGAWTAYAASARVIIVAFATAPYNLSLLARLHALLPERLVLSAYPVVAGVALSATLLALRRTGGSRDAIQTIDLEFAAFMTLALLLSPVAWHHYVVMLALPIVFVAIAAWKNGGRTALASACALAIVLSLPDDLWRAIWRQMSGRPALLVSPGVAVLLLWAALLHAGGRDRLVTELRAGSHPAISRRHRGDTTRCVHGSSPDVGAHARATFDGEALRRIAAGAPYR